jgi:predicted O-methyltransferase YrrM
MFLVPIVGTSLAITPIKLTGDNPAQMTAQAVGWCMVTLLPGAFCLGGVFPIAWEQVKAGVRSEGTFLGLALGLNKLGCAAGCAIGSFLLLPFLGLVRGMEVIAWGYALVALAPALSARQRPIFWAGLALLTAFGLFQTTRPSQGLGIISTLRLVSSYSGIYGPVSVVEDTTTGSRQILLNSRQRLSGTAKAVASQRHQSWVPLLFCPKPERVVAIGMAAGISASAALDYPIKELFSVELVPEVVQAAREHFREWNAPLFEDPRSKILVGDGRAVLGRMEGHFDAIICDLFFPSDEGSALLYSREFFQSAKARLNPGGVFCLWLPCYQHTPESSGIIIHTFKDAFPHAVIVRANFDPQAPVLGLLGSAQVIPFSRDFLTEQLASPAGKLLATQSPFFNSADTAMLLLVCDLYSADPGFEVFRTTTDDHPLFSYFGPRQPRGTERLFGFPFLDWIGKRSLRPYYPSCELGQMAPEQLLNSVRAGNFYFAAAAADLSLPGDRRPASVRTDQVRTYYQRALELSPNARVPFEALGR